MKEQKREFLQLELVILETALKKTVQRLREFETMDAKQRYLQLLEEEPDILNLVSLTHIASYLGINLGSLSRIRSIISHM